MQPNTTPFFHDNSKCALPRGFDPKVAVGPFKGSLCNLNLEEIISNPSTRWDSRTSNWSAGDEIGEGHCNKWKNCNHGYDWNVYLSYYEERTEHFWEFSLIPPLHRNNMNIQGTVLVFRATRDHYNIVRGFHTSYLKDTGKTCSSRLADVCCFQPDGHKAISFEKLFEFMELCRSWHGSPDLTIV